MVTVKVHPLVLPAPSVTTQVTCVLLLLNTVPLMVPVPVPVVAPLKVHTRLAAGMGELGQLSVAVTSNSEPIAVYEQVPATVLRLVVAGHTVTTGDWLSYIVTVKVQLDELPAASVAFQVTRVLPLLNTTPARVVVLVVVVPVVAPDSV